MSRGGSRAELHELRQRVVSSQLAVGTDVPVVVDDVGTWATVDVADEDGGTARVVCLCPAQFVPAVGQKVTLRMDGHVPTVIAQQMSPVAFAAGPLRAAVAGIAADQVNGYGQTIVVPQFAAVAASLALIRARLDALEAQAADHETRIAALEPP